MRPLPLIALAQAMLPAWPLAVRDEYYTVEEALALAFPAASSFEEHSAILTRAEVEALEGRLRASRVGRVFRWRTARSEGRVLGYAVVGDCLGKSEPITYLVALEPDLTVRSVEVLAYRESHGAEIRHADFRRQYVGKRSGSELRIGRDVRNIAGATISCASLTDAVHDVLKYAAELIEPVESSGEAGGADPSGSTGASAALEGPFSRAQLLMGTTLELTVHSASREAGAAAMTRAFAEVARLEGLLSAFRPESEVGKINASAGGDPVPLSADTREALRRARDLARETGGAFDPALGPLVALWRDAARRGAEPESPMLLGARAASGFEHLELGPAGARLDVEGAALDLGGFGKGYALERAAEELRAGGVRVARLSFGGMVLCLDPPPGADAWEVPLRDPRAPERVVASLHLANACAATTADYERGLVIGERRVSHVVDPRTGLPADGLVGATVVHARAGDADAWSTALFVLAGDEALALAGERGIAALLFSAGGELRTPALEASGALRSSNQER